MLTNLHISNIVLIEKLNLEFGRGLNVLTGETGAGKSILLDALSLALGARSDTGLIRHGCDSANIIAEFSDIKNSNNLKNILDENSIDFDGNIILRRTLASDGKNKAWVNDIPVSIKLLKQIGDELVEIHGQFENHTLLDQSTHRKTLDDFGKNNRGEKYTSLLNNVRGLYNDLHGTELRLKELTELIARSESERDFLEHNVAELSALKPQVGEEEELALRRSVMMNAEKNTTILSDAINILNPKGQGIDSQIFSAVHVLERIKSDPNPYQAQIDKLYEIAGALGEVSEKLSPMDIDTGTLESVEERLFAIRAAARKHRIIADELPAKLIQMSEQLNAIDNSDAELEKIKSEVSKKKIEFNNIAKQLNAERIAASEDLRKQILNELPDLKLGQADFIVSISECSPSAYGIDDITFMIKTNPGTPFAPLHKTASGGELARLMLALRVVLTDENTARIFVFDEVDTGISGATASAVGSRLGRLAADNQALVITHSAQVAGFADKHFKISKHTDTDITTTTVSEITDDARINEIARIISGAEITPESIATAKTLMKK